MGEKVCFENSKGFDLFGVFSNPTSSKLVPVMVLCHGFGTSKDGRTSIRLQESLNSQGISTFRFDFFGHGESQGDLKDITVSEAVDDILKAIYFVKARGYSRIGLVGSSFGGTCSLIAASKTSDLFVLALKSPVSDYEEVVIKRIGREGLGEWEEMGRREFETFDGKKIMLRISFFQDLEKNDVYEAAKTIEIRTLIVHGDKDQVVPIEQSKKAASLIKFCELEIIEGADHRYSNPENFKKLINLISKFIFENSTPVSAS